MIWHSRPTIDTCPSLPFILHSITKKSLKILYTKARGMQKGKQLDSKSKIWNYKFLFALWSSYLILSHSADHHLYAMLPLQSYSLSKLDTIYIYTYTHHSLMQLLFFF
jgi:hypothetical protein